MQLDDAAGSMPPMASGATGMGDVSGAEMGKSVGGAGEETPLISRDGANVKRSLPQLLALNSFGAAYGMVYTAMGMVILPRLSEILDQQHHALLLGLWLGLAGITQLVSPVTGVLSDRHVGRWGARRPFVFWGAILGTLSLALMYVGFRFRLMVLFCVAFFFGMTGLNVAYSGFIGLVSDVVPQSQGDWNSGILAAVTMIGTLFGVCMCGFVLDLDSSYPFLGGCMVLFTAFTLIGGSILERDIPPRQPSGEHMSILMLFKSFKITPASHGDFFWVFVGRTFYYMSVSLQTFLLFYLRDMIHITKVKQHVAVLAITAQLSAATCAWPAGWLSEKIGRKSLIFVSCGVMSVVYVGYIVCPVYLDGQFGQVLVLAVVYGIGNGFYLAADFALATGVELMFACCVCDVDRMHVVKCALSSLMLDLQRLFLLRIQGAVTWAYGALRLQAFLGTLVGPVGGGALLHAFGAIKTHGVVHYSVMGYIAMVLSGVVYAFLSGASVYKIKSN